MTDTISHDDADLCLTILMGASSYGWDEASVRFYRGMFMEWENAHVLAEACREVATAHTKAEKPAPGVIKAAYQARLRRHQLETPAIGPSEALFPTFEEGVEIARTAYHAECYRMGKNPNDELFDSFLGLNREERKALERSRQAKRG
jgi:hypothetical protein